MVKPKALKIVFAASPLSTYYLGVRTNTGRPRVKIMVMGEFVRLPVDCLFRDLARLKSDLAFLFIVQIRVHSSLVINVFSSYICMNYLQRM